MTTQKKSKLKKRFLIVLSIIIVPILCLKTYFEVDNIIYQKRVDKMNIQTDPKDSFIEHKTLKIDGYNIHYYESGKQNDDLIVLLHPAFADHRAFAQQIDYFSKSYRVITIDLIGYGLSKTNDSKDKIDASSKHIENILEVEGFDKAHIIGVSMGSWIAQYFALNNPDKVKSLTALGGYDINKRSKELEQAQSSSKLSLILRALFSMKSYRKKTAEITCKTETGQALFYEASSYCERKTFIVMAGLLNVLKIRDNIKPQYPILILTGEFDSDLAKEMAEEWHSNINNSELIILKNAGHCANVDIPLEFNKLVDQFIQQTNNNYAQQSGSNDVEAVVL